MSASIGQAALSHDPSFRQLVLQVITHIRSVRKKFYPNFVRRDVVATFVMAAERKVGVDVVAYLPALDLVDFGSLFGCADLSLIHNSSPVTELVLLHQW